jgi:hypothetical protein
MTKRTLGLALTVLLGLCGPRLSAYEPVQDKMFQINLLLQRGDPLGSHAAGTIEVLSRPTILAREKQTSCIRVGQTAMLAGEALEVGFSAQVVAESTPKGKIRLRVAVEVGELVENDGNRSSVRIDRNIYVREVMPGEVVRLRVGQRSQQETWLELTVQEVTGQGTAAARPERRFETGDWSWVFDHLAGRLGP